MIEITDSVKCDQQSRSYTVRGKKMPHPRQSDFKVTLTQKKI